jgi:hypothetical protein
LTNRNCVNMSYNGMSTFIAESVFLDYLDRNDPPEVLFLEITNLIADHELMGDMKLYSSDSTRINNMVQIYSPKTYYLLKISRLFQFNGELFLRCLYYLKHDDQNWINRSLINPSFAKNYRIEDGRKSMNVLTKDENLTSLRNILDVCKERSIKAKLIISPYLLQHANQITDFDDWKSNIQNAVGIGHKIWDYSTLLDDVELFADPLHMNINGSNEFMRRIIRDGVL